jgi:hypothetical protein
MGDVRVRIDTASGIIEVDAPADVYADVLDRVKSFLPAVNEAKGGVEVQQGNSSGAGDKAVRGIETLDSGAKKTSRKSTGSRQSYQFVELGLTEVERSDLKSFFKDHEPKGQNEQTVVLMSWFRATKAKESMTWDEVYSAFRTVDAKVPGRIGSVMSNLNGKNWTKGAAGQGYSLTHVGEDYVKFDLPRKKKES